MNGWKVPVGIDPTRPHVARMYDYYLGGDNNFPADREEAEKVLRVAPWIRPTAQANRDFLIRAVEYLVNVAGIRQFLDIGTGLPTRRNVHEVAHAAAPDARVAYVDNDPLVLAQSRALLANTSNAITVRTDLRYPEAIITHPEIADFIDWSEPVALLLVAILHFIDDDSDPINILSVLNDALAPESHLVISHIHHQGDEGAVNHLLNIYRNANAKLVMRSATEIERFFKGYQLVDPGLVHLSKWRPTNQPNDLEHIWGIGGIGRKTPTRREERQAASNVTRIQSSA